MFIISNKFYVRGKTSAIFNIPEFVQYTIVGIRNKKYAHHDPCFHLSSLMCIALCFYAYCIRWNNIYTWRQLELTVLCMYQLHRYYSLKKYAGSYHWTFYSIYYIFIYILFLVLCSIGNKYYIILYYNIGIWHTVALHCKNNSVFILYNLWYTGLVSGFARRNDN